MYAEDRARSAGALKGRAPARQPQAVSRTPLPDLLALQSAVGNAAVVQMLCRAGHPWAQERHQDGADRNQQQTEHPVQRSTVHDILRTGGRPLDDGTRAEMEARLGADFSDVRIHNDAAAKTSAAEVGARAYTSGSHIVIGNGGTDKHTLAHELTHVIQQRQGPVAGVDHGDGLRVSDPSDRFERQAEANARRVMAGPVRRATEAVPASDGGTAGAGREPWNSEAIGVQRVVTTRNSAMAPAPTALTGSRDAVIDQIKSDGEKARRWIADYEPILDELKAAPDTFTVADNTPAEEAIGLLTAFYIKTGQTAEGNPISRVVTYLLHGGGRPPNIGGFGTLAVEGTELTGRPNFATATQEALPLRPLQHRRHYIAWHNIRSLLNRAYAEHAGQLIPYLTAKLGAGQVHAGMNDESNKSLAKMPLAQFGNGNRDHAEILMRAAYVMNSSVNNLWVGGGRENSEINALSHSLQTQVRQVTPQSLAAWHASLQASAVKSAQAQRARDNVLVRIENAHAALGAAPTAAQQEHIIARLKEEVWQCDIRFLETDVPESEDHASAGSDAIVVGDAVFDAVFFPDVAFPFDVVRAAVDFLWTSS
ncbi:DUF4157 domain-containing protein [Streptomyces sp. NPDC052042]|uniref:DUF4157 domain-containing protein n=1 Tax=Streptomyces sp. NPDC052042 TaxID=3365683 RepID=UPI0037D807B8